MLRKKNPVEYDRIIICCVQDGAVFPARDYPLWSAKTTALFSYKKYFIDQASVSDGFLLVSSFFAKNKNERGQYPAIQRPHARLISQIYITSAVILWAPTIWSKSKFAD